MQTDTPVGIVEAYADRLFAVMAADMHGLMTGLKACPLVATSFSFGASYHVTLAPGATPDALRSWLTAKGYAEVGITEISPSVEDCFMALMKTSENDRRKSYNSRKPDKALRQFVATDHISFSVRRGEIFGFLGANGAGKTTAMRMLCGLSRPSEGRAVVAGFDVASQAEQVKRHIGYMSQKFSLYDDLTVAENMRLFGGIYGMGRRQIAERTAGMLSDLGLESERNSLVKSLPLGWKQKLALRLPYSMSRR